MAVTSPQVEHTEAELIPAFCDFDKLAASWDTSTHRLWSLLEFVKVFRARALGNIVLALGRDLDVCVARAKKSEKGEVIRQRSESEQITKVIRDIRHAWEICGEAGLKNAEDQIGFIVRHVKWQTNEVAYSALCGELRHTINAILQDLNQRTFLEVGPALREYVDNDLLFGAAVRKAFPSALVDIREAGNCLAADCNTAAVFHLMRVAEYGLRTLAYDRRIRLDKDKPIDLATWEDLLKKLEDAEDAIRNFPKTSAREAQFDFFHGANMEVKRFKNKFRNRIMHSRESYDEHEAMSAFGHVKAFMQILSSRISEGTRTPVIWKGSKWYG